MTNIRLQVDLSAFIDLCNARLQVTTVTGHDGNGRPILDTTTTRTYRCYIQANERTSWSDREATDGMPNVAYVLSVPVNQSDAVPIRKNDQMEILAPSSYAGIIRRIGTIKSYEDQYGNLHNMAITFE